MARTAASPSCSSTKRPCSSEYVDISSVLRCKSILNCRLSQSANLRFRCAVILHACEHSVVSQGEIPPLSCIQHCTTTTVRCSLRKGHGVRCYVVYKQSSHAPQLPRLIGAYIACFASVWIRITYDVPLVRYIQVEAADGVTIYWTVDVVSEEISFQVCMSNSHVALIIVVYELACLNVVSRFPGLDGIGQILADFWRQF